MSGAPWLKVYDNGPAVDPRCPVCKRICSSADTTVKVDEFGYVPPMFTGWECSEHGPFQPEIICEARDLKCGSRW